MLAPWCHSLCSVQDIKKYHMSKIQIVSFNFRCRNSGKVRVWHPNPHGMIQGHVVAEGQRWVGEGAASLTDLLQAMGSQGWFPRIKSRRWDLSFPFWRAAGRAARAVAELTAGAVEGSVASAGHRDRSWVSIPQNEGSQHRGAGFPSLAPRDSNVCTCDRRGARLSAACKDAVCLCRLPGCLTITQNFTA